MLPEKPWMTRHFNGAKRTKSDCWPWSAGGRVCNPSRYRCPPGGEVVWRAANRQCFEIGKEEGLAASIFSKQTQRRSRWKNMKFMVSHFNINLS
ncbi:MAG: hypothetical protein Q8M07_09210, partial [Prosthecobacter sp.]|nr:hypothetical protein [Prosthecobacter sp.]